MYIVVTPAKDEEDYLPAVADAVIGQTRTPKLWLIVDDGSTDGTPEIVGDLQDENEWIQGIRLPPRERDITFHYSYVCRTGFDLLTDYCDCAANHIDYDFIGLLDADTVPEPGYFEKLINEFDRDGSLGIASGHIHDMPDGNVRWGEIKRDWPDGRLPRGSGRLWRKECFFDTGGYPVEPAPDSISNAKAIMRGWNVKRFGHIVAVQLRGTRSAEGLWKGYKTSGSIAHYVNKHPVLVFLNSCYLAAKKPHYTGIAYGYGYLTSVLRRVKQIDDEEIRDYYWNERLREYMRGVLKSVHPAESASNSLYR